MTDEVWHDPARRAFGVLLDGQAILETDRYGERVFGDTLFIALNASPDPVPFTLPSAETIPFRAPASGDYTWELVLDTTQAETKPAPRAPGQIVEGVERSAAIYRLVASR
jgi:glycogen operon protein